MIKRAIVTTVMTYKLLCGLCRIMNTNSMHDMPSDLAKYVSQLKYYERMQKVKEREQHVQEVS